MHCVMCMGIRTRIEICEGMVFICSRTSWTTQEDAGVNQFVAIPLNNGDLWNPLSTSWSTPGKYKYCPGCPGTYEYHAPMKDALNGT